jgi:hypothetical protein
MKHHFEDTPESVTTIHGVMPTSALVKKTGIDSDERADMHWVEYRLKGDPTDTIVHRSVHGYLKQGLSLFGEQGQMN